jgi:hypothetical protein
MAEPAGRSVTGITEGVFYDVPPRGPAGEVWPLSTCVQLCSCFILCLAKAKMRRRYPLLSPLPPVIWLPVSSTAVAMFGRLRPNVDLRYHACGAGEDLIQ